ncbi:Acid phosphatase [Entamoeba marina]
MIHLIFILIVLQLTLSIKCHPPTFNYKTLKDYQTKKVLILTRHGNRASLVNDQVLNICNGVKGGCRDAELTDIGKNQLFSLGQNIQKTFNFTEKLSLNNILIQSSNSQRTIESAIQFSSGLLGEKFLKNELTINSNILPYCDNYECNNIVQQHHNSFFDINPQVENVLQKFKRILHYLDITNTMYSYFIVFDHMTARMCSGMELPCYNGECILENDLSLLTTFNEYVYLHRHSKEIASYESANLILDITKELNGDFNCNNGTCNVNYQHFLTLFSGHDNTIIDVLHLLGVDVFEWIPFASNIIFEVVEKENVQYVRAFYNSNKIRLCTSHKSLCELKEFNDWMHSLIHIA